MKAIVDALVQVTLYSAAITAGILLFRFIFKKRISSKLQYLMWWLLILRLLMPVTPDIGLHFNLQDTLLKQAHQAELPTPAPVLDVAPASVPNTQSSYESVAPAVQRHRVPGAVQHDEAVAQQGQQNDEKGHIKAGLALQKPFFAHIKSPPG